jgi:hypothetical protein
MLDVINLFRDKETRDELGIGTIRDAFADLFFPGTSTIQTRARYFLFIPWIYIKLEQKGVKSAKIGQPARYEEVRLINALYNNGMRDGLIGINARGSLKRLPSAIYWQGLGQWGLRLFDGARAVYHRSLDGFYAANKQVSQFQGENRSEDDIGEMQLRQQYNWHPGLLALRPDNFPDEATFTLSTEEAEYLQERIVSSQSGSLLAFLAAETRPLDRTAYPWEHPDWARFPTAIQEYLTHARLFSLAIHGAALLYNLMLAEQAMETISRERQEQVDSYRMRLDDWASEMRQYQQDYNNWDWQARFWQIVFLGNPRIPWRTQRFVQSWLTIIVAENNVTHLADSTAARQLLRERERRLKGKLARLHNPRSLELWNGEAGTGRLNYRWGVTQTILGDILEGLDHA